MNLLATAEKYAQCGISVIRIKCDGSKSPVGYWKTYQERKATSVELKKWFKHDGFVGIGIVCGAVSGNLEVIDLESWEMCNAWGKEIAKMGRADLRDKCVAVRAPRGGAHVYYRCEQIEGNQKLAQEWIDYTDPETGEVKQKPSTLIETRGEGGYVIAPGSPGAAHPSGNVYELFKLDFNQIPIITPEERQTLLNAARAFNQVIDARPLRSEAPQAVARVSVTQKPGEDFSSQHSWASILEPHGWTFQRAQGDEEYWQRPGKDGRGISATINYAGSDLLKVFSSNAYPFEQNRTYTKFGAYTELNYRGDYSACARALAKLGYGEPLPFNRYVEPETHLVEIPNLPGEILNSLGPEFDTEFGNCARLVRYFGSGIRYTKEQDWMVWTGSRWTADESGFVRELIKKLPARIREEASFAEATLEIGESVVNMREAIFKHAKKSATAKAVKATLYLAESELNEKLTAFDKNHYWLNLKDCTVDLVSSERWDHRVNDLLTRQAATSYGDESEDCPNWKRFLETIIPDAQVREFLQRAVGYSLTGDVSEQKLFFCYGTGANGKSTFLDVILAMLGSYAMATPTETFIAEKRPAISNDLARLVGARFVRVSETEEGQRLAESLIKQVTGGPLARISTRFLNHEYFEYTPQFKAWFDGNHKPILKGVDKGIKRRLMLIPFTVTVPEEKQDKMLAVKLLAELPGILRWAIDGAVEWHKLREQSGSGLKPPAAVLDFTNEYFDDMDPVAAFFLEECEMTGEVEATDLYEAFKRRQERNGQGVISQMRFGLQMDERGFKRASDPVTRRKKYQGISLKYTVK